MICPNPSHDEINRHQKGDRNNGFHSQRLIKFIWTITALTLLYYAFILTNGTFDFFAPEALGEVFNNMALNLLRGDFSVDPKLVGVEGMVRDGKTYVYFGIFPALLRLPLVPILNLETILVSRVSVMLALAISLILQVKTWLLVYATMPSTAVCRHALLIVVASLFCSSPYVLLASNASIYHEPISWAAAAVSLFNYCLVGAALSGGRASRPALYLMAIAAGSCILMRVTVAIGLYIALGALIVADLIQTYRDDQERDRSTAMLRLALKRSFGPLIVLGAFGLAYLAVNNERWGDPLRSAYYEGYSPIQDRSERRRAFEEFGVFDYRRIPAAIQYYAIGSWRLGELLISLMGTKFDWVERPYGSMLLMSPVFIALSMAGMSKTAALLRKNGRDYWIIVTGLLAEAVPLVLLLSFMALTLRYRMDCWAFISLAAIPGFQILVPYIEKLSSGIKRTLLGVTWLGVIVGVLASHLVLFEYKLYDPLKRSGPIEAARGFFRYAMEVGDSLHSFIASWLFN